MCTHAITCAHKPSHVHTCIICAHTCQHMPSHAHTHAITCAHKCKNTATSSYCNTCCLRARSTFGRVWGFLLWFVFLFACLFLIHHMTEHGFKSLVPLNRKYMFKTLQGMPETAGASDYVFLSILKIKFNLRIRQSKRAFKNTQQKRTSSVPF